MVGHTIIAILLVALIILSIRHINVKRQLKNIDKQLKEESPRRRSISIELSDNSVESLTLTINRLLEEHNKIIIDIEKDNQYLKNSIADISHDMRTPLTSIIGYLQLLKRSNLENEQSHNLSIALEKSQYLRKLLTDFHELSVLKTSNSIAKLERVDLARLLSETILEHVDEFSHKGLSPIFETADSPVFILSNPEKLSRVFQNLISNCLKYSCGDVTFKIIENDKVTLEIQNPIKSMNELDVERVFDRFYKADCSRSEQGTGLGLAISKLLVENMKGEILASVSKGMFTVRIDFLKFKE
jgi:signal transduction histidine kinase